MTWPAPSLNEKGCPRSRLLSNCTSQQLVTTIERRVHFTVDASEQGSVPSHYCQPQAKLPEERTAPSCRSGVYPCSVPTPCCLHSRVSLPPIRQRPFDHIPFGGLCVSSRTSLINTLLCEISSIPFDGFSPFPCLMVSTSTPTTRKGMPRSDHDSTPHTLCRYTACYCTAVRIDKYHDGLGSIE